MIAVIGAMATGAMMTGAVAKGVVATEGLMAIADPKVVAPIIQGRAVRAAASTSTILGTVSRKAIQVMGRAVPAISDRSQAINQDRADPGRIRIRHHRLADRVTLVRALAPVRTATATIRMMALTRSTFTSFCTTTWAAVRLPQCGS